MLPRIIGEHPRQRRQRKLKSRIATVFPYGKYDCDVAGHHATSGWPMSICSATAVGRPEPLSREEEVASGRIRST